MYLSKQKIQSKIDIYIHIYILNTLPYNLHFQYKNMTNQQCP
jgi:hypothetical protein